MNKKDVDIFEKANAQIRGMYEEFNLLSKKNPNDAVNKFKLTFINQLLETTNSFLSDRYKPFKDFNVFDEEELPSNSDVAMIMSQYLKSMEQLRSENVKFNYGKYYWVIDGEETDIETKPPERTGRK